MAEKRPNTDIAQNKKAYHDYEVIETYEAGIELRGTEIKSVRSRNVNLKDSFILVRDGQALAQNIHISPWGYGNIFNHDPTRARRLLLHKKEILRMHNLIMQKGYTLVPLKIYIKGRFAKIQVGLVKGKQVHDKRDVIREKDIKRDMDRDMKNYRG
ncbi:MAG: SsrA-binding protein [Spirochaetes bacterium GWF1_51_8]|nr:MAG: SsrA-binding protein [Spirochaetes bacterium GWF1_51_8]